MCVKHTTPLEVFYMGVGLINRRFSSSKGRGAQIIVKVSTIVLENLDMAGNWINPAAGGPFCHLFQHANSLGLHLSTELARA